MLYNMFIVNMLCTFKGQIYIPQKSLFLFVKISRKVLHFVTFCYIFREAFILFVVLCHRSTLNRSKVERRTSTPDFAALLPVFLPCPDCAARGRARTTLPTGPAAESVTCTARWINWTGGYWRQADGQYGLSSTGEGAGS